MLTKDQMDEWTEQVEYARGYVCDRIASPWANAIIAVDAELTALRTQVEELTMARDEMPEQEIEWQDAQPEEERLATENQFLRRRLVFGGQGLRNQVAAQRAALVAAQTGLAFEGVRVAEVDAIIGTEGLPSWMKDDAALGKEESESC